MIDYHPLPPGFRPDDMIAGKHRCPTCTQQTYLRPVDLSSVLIHALRIISLRSAEGAVTTGNDMARYGRTVYCNYSQLKYWGLIFEDRPAGGWRLTSEGMDFLAGNTQLPMRVWVFADEVRTWDNAPFAPVVSIDSIKPYAPRSRQEARERLVGIEHEE